MHANPDRNYQGKMRKCRRTPGIPCTTSAENTESGTPMVSWSQQRPRHNDQGVNVVDRFGRKLLGGQPKRSSDRKLVS